MQMSIANSIHILFCNCGVVAIWCTDTSASRHFGTGAEVSVGHFGMITEVVMLVNGGSYVVDGVALGSGQHLYRLGSGLVLVLVLV